MSAVLPYSQVKIASRGSLVETRNAILCGLAVVVAVALTNPISESPFNDDWSYSFTVRHLLETGKLTYNGWASASLIAQAYWGWLWVKIFGFSYTVLRLSTLPLAAAAVSICYLLGRRVGLNARFAVFASLMLGLSPLYIPVASSFMTDAPGLFFTLLSMYALARAMDSASSGRAINWLVFGAIVGLVGGTGRQIVWVVPLVMLPYAAWIRRENISLVISALVAWSVVFGGAMLTLRWFAHQPYSIPEQPISYELKIALHKPEHFLLNVLAIPLTAIWVMLPALWGRLSRGWKGNRGVVAFILLIVPVMCLVLARPKYGAAPWMGNTLSKQGIMGGAELAGERPVVLPLAVRIAVGVVVFSVLCILSADFLLWLTRPLTAARKTMRFFLYPEAGRALLPGMILFAAAYFALLLPRCATNMAYDRYILPMMPCMLFPLLLNYQAEREWKVPKIGWILLAVYAAFAIAITQEVTALCRARAEAANRILSSDPKWKRTDIDAGFEFDYETQLFQTGYINDPRILLPKGAYHKDVGPTYAVQPKYRLEFAPAIDTTETSFGSVPYTTYLYPFHRKVYIDEFKDPWWRDPARAATHPSDKRHQMMHAPGPDDEQP
jgi:4-amino-4-deoxy-L-arabinose transferase-like glycosyltransferase